MTVTTSTCFLCHFKDGLFNEGLGTCTRCHQIPENTFDLGGGVKFSHDLAYERGVDCANCHSDLIRGNGEVPPERCTVCHNREDDLKRIDDHEFIHQKHVTDHKVDCLECHLEIQHSLDPHRIEHAASDCKLCHPNQHGEQIRMLLGEGGKSIPAQQGGMAVAGFPARPVTRSKKSRPPEPCSGKPPRPSVPNATTKRRPKDSVLVTSSFKDSLADIEANLSRAREAVRAANLDETRTAEITQRLRDLEDDLQFLRVGNSIHNMHYADSLTRALVDKLRAICRELNIAEPAVNLPTGAGLAE